MRGEDRLRDEEAFFPQIGNRGSSNKEKYNRPDGEDLSPFQSITASCRDQCKLRSPHLCPRGPRLASRSRMILIPMIGQWLVVVGLWNGGPIRVW